MLVGFSDGLITPIESDGSMGVLFVIILSPVLVWLVKIEKSDFIDSQLKITSLRGK